ncbi:MAG: hypothetical protein R3313_04345, partial [Candidatus Saccharimonadales bacterium]|nr:hypothetical protein [Candidatus Saccharimonadales bacterium]
FAEYLSIAIGGLLIFAGIIEIKEFFWYGKGPSLTIPKKFANKIHDYASTKSSVIGILLLGVLVAAVGLPSTGAPYLAILTILRAEFSLAALTLMVLYAFIFILPLIIILFMVASGSKISTIARWKEQSKDTMRLFIGLLLAVLGWMLILIANGTINFG